MTALNTFVSETTTHIVMVFYRGADDDLHQQSGRLVMMDETGVLLLRNNEYVFYAADRVVKVEQREDI